MSINIVTVDPTKRKPRPKDESKLGFGKYFSDHMFLMDYSPSRGWHNAHIQPYGPLNLDPATSVLHYGQEAFEGLKAYRGKDNGIYLFRHRDNIKRMNASCERLVMPPLPVELVSDAIRQLVILDREWIPRCSNCALYIRPNIIGVDPQLGVRPSDTFLFYVIIGPVGAYYPEGFNPVSIFVSDQYVRAVRGGIGQAKTSGNYAASLLAQQEARTRGYSQVLWLDGVERRFVEEVGTMNIFFKIGDELVTSPLTGSILPGITRDSTLEVLRYWQLPVSERLLSIDDLVAGLQDGSVTEVFGTGTAAIIAPVGTICFKGKDYKVGDGKTGPVSQRLFDYLLAVQCGNEPDRFGWVERID